MKSSIIIPVYNEESSIKSVLEEVGKTMGEVKLDYELIVVDDGSTDKTPRILSKIKGIRVIKNDSNQGYGASIKKGVRKAENDLIVLIDGDGTYPINEIPRLLGFASEYDMVVGSRTGDYVKVELYRKPAKYFLSLLANYLSGVRIPDLNSGLRVFNRKTMLQFFHLLPEGFSCTTTMTLAYLSNDYTIKYAPIDYHPRKGRSKIRPMRDGLNFVLLIIRTILYFRPLKVFIPASLTLFLIGLADIIYNLYAHSNITDLSVMIVLASLQIGFLGLLADLIARYRTDVYV